MKLYTVEDGPLNSLWPNQELAIVPSVFREGQSFPRGSGYAWASLRPGSRSQQWHKTLPSKVTHPVGPWYGWIWFPVGKLVVPVPVTGQALSSTIVRATNTQLVGWAPCCKTAMITPEGRTQKLAPPLKKASLVHKRVPLVLSENVVVRLPGVVLGEKLM